VGDPKLTWVSFRKVSISKSGAKQMIDQKTGEEVNTGKGNWGLEDEVRNHLVGIAIHMF
jgi:hypothetical protein